MIITKRTRPLELTAASFTKPFIVSKALRYDSDDDDDYGKSSLEAWTMGHRPRSSKVLVWSVDNATFSSPWRSDDDANYPGDFRAFSFAMGVGCILLQCCCPMMMH